jgi:hypothetical protein
MATNKAFRGLFINRLIEMWLDCSDYRFCRGSCAFGFAAFLAIDVIPDEQACFRLLSSVWWDL